MSYFQLVMTRGNIILSVSNDEGNILSVNNDGGNIILSISNDER